MRNSESKFIDDQFLFVKKEVINIFQLNCYENHLFKEKKFHFESEFQSRWNEVH
jgi:hypothetical protein